MKDLIAICHQAAIKKGFWEKPNLGEKIALIHSELSEALEALRKGDPESSKIPGFSEAEEEFADCIIRIFDIAGRENYNLLSAIFAKIEYNKTRPYKHNKEF